MIVRLGAGRVAAVARSRTLEGFHPCGCGWETLYKGWQRRSQETLAGRIRWKWGYSTVRLATGAVPLDEALGIGRGQFSGGLQSRLCRLGQRCPLFKPGAGNLASVLTALRSGEATSELHYFEPHRHRMGYAGFRAQGYPMGSARWRAPASS